MPELELLSLQQQLERDHVPHAVATVVKVVGSASAKPGAKMLVSAQGENLWGWIGGGCAESFTRANALEAISEGYPRTIVADLDDEVFGLGMPCGGKMEIFVEPKLPPTLLRFTIQESRALRTLAEHFGFSVAFSQTGQQELEPQDCLHFLVQAIAAARKIKLRSLQEEKQLAPANKFQFRGSPSELLILGHSRITEELAKLGALLGWKTKVYGLNLDPAAYPKNVIAEPAQAEYAGLNFSPNSFVVVASHHKGDHHYLQQALEHNAAYVGLIASAKRANLVREHLQSIGMEDNVLRRVRAPCGLNLACRNPGEIALSIIGELLQVEASS